MRAVGRFWDSGGRRAPIEASLGSEPPLCLVRVHELLARGGVAVSYATSREPGWRKQAPTPQFGFYQARVASDDFIFDELNPNLLAP